MNGISQSNQNVPIAGGDSTVTSGERSKAATSSAFMIMIALCFLYHLTTLVVALYGVLPYYPGTPSVEPEKVIGAALGGSGAGISATIFMCARRYPPLSQSMLVRLLVGLNIAPTTYVWVVFTGDYPLVVFMFALGAFQLVWFSCLGFSSNRRGYESPTGT